MGIFEQDTTTPKVIDLTTKSPTPDKVHRDQERRQKELGESLRGLCARALYACTTRPVKAVVKVPKGFEDGVICAVANLTDAGWEVTVARRWWLRFWEGYSWRIRIIIREPAGGLRPLTPGHCEG